MSFYTVKNPINEFFHFTILRRSNQKILFFDLWLGRKLLENFGSRITDRVGQLAFAISGADWNWLA